MQRLSVHGGEMYITFFTSAMGWEMVYTYHPDVGFSTLLIYRLGNARSLGDG
ncbi:MAG: hypothetical protein IKX59_04130 [Bacteroidales bacterium]|nr:hypothetical protein [Bacteroidales bacterium]